MTLRPRVVLLAVATAVFGIIGTWSPALGSAWQIPAVVILVMLIAEYLDARGWPLAVALDQPRQLGLGAKHHAKLVVHNNGQKQRALRFYPVAPRGIETIAADAIQRIAAGERFAHPFELSGSLLGKHPWPSQPIEIRGLFGLADWIRRLDLSATSTVLPNMQHLTRLHRGSATAGQRADLIASGSGDEPRGLREYVAGDAPGAIDWKATARHRGLMVREMAHPQHVEIVIALDVGQTSGLACGELTVLGHAVNVAAQLAVAAELRGDRSGMLIYADRVLDTLPPGHGVNHQRRQQKLLATTATSPTESNPLPAIVSLSKLAHRRSLIVLFAQLQDAEANGQLLRAIQLLRPKHLPLIVALRDPEIDALKNARATTWVEPYVSLAAQEYRRDVKAVRQRLRRLGAEVVETTPEHLSDVVLRRYQDLRQQRRI